MSRRDKRAAGWLFIAMVCWLLPRLPAQIPASPQQRPATGQAASLPSPAKARDGHQRMLQLLREIKQRSAVENAYVGRAVADPERAQLAALPADAPEAQRARLHASLGRHELKMGNNREAVEHLLATYNLAGLDSTTALREIAVAYLRLGETENCVHAHTSESCILPIRGSGIHRRQGGARKAIEYLRQTLEKAPNDLTARWLLNIASMTVGEYPEKVPQQFLIPPSVFESEEEFPRFRDVAPELGLDIRSLSGGAIADDFDNDGWLDIVVSDWDPGAQIRYFRNNGDGSFRERTAEAGLTGLVGGLNLIQADYDNDGDTDILVLRGAWLEQAGRHPNSLLANDGKGRFHDVTFEAGLGEVHYPTQTAAWADCDNDGDLDLYIGNETFPSQLFRNNGDRTFTDVAEQAGVTNDEVAKAVAWGDYDNDRLPDLYVSNLGAPNRLYHNNGDGTFTDVATELDVLLPFKSFPAWFWDFNNDGALDLFVTSYERRVEDVAAGYLGIPVTETEPDSLYQGDGKGGFRDVAAEVNLNRVTQPMGSNFGDLDHDGFLDFYLGTGYPGYEGLMPNLLFHNRGGKRFSNITTAAGMGHLQKGHGVAFADFDQDGDQDVFAEMGGAYAGDAFANALFENPGFGNHWLGVKLIGVTSNRSAIGARIRAEILEDSRPRSVYRWVNSGGSFGANPLQQQIGLGRAQRVERLEIFWPTSGRTQAFENVAVDQFLEITEGETTYRKVPRKAVRFPAARH